MKNFLLSITLIISIGVCTKLNAQCTVSNVSVELNSLGINNGNCVMNVNLTFNLEHNNGNKYIWIHLWKASGYPGLTYSGPPTKAQLSGDLVNIGINNNVTPALLMSSYGPDPSVPVQSAGLTVSVIPGSPDIITVHNITLTIPGSCTSAASIKGDMWSTQAQSQNAVHCSSKGSLNFIPNDPTITGFKRCTTPRTLSLGIQTTSALNAQVSYTLYKDNGNGIYEPGSGDVSVGSGGPFTINSGSPYSNANVTYTGNNSSGENSSIWVAVTSSLIGTGTIVSLFESACSALPIKLTYFNAQRSSAGNVGITWQTAQEINSSGFEIQRQMGSGGWQAVAFVNSKAQDGNSSSILTYTYNDNNNTKAITQYRLRSVDIDANSKFSETRSVRGDGQPGKMILYPNPSFDGRVKVVFEDINGTRDVSLTDMSGRLVKQWRGVTNNNLEMDNITPGYYSLRVIVRETGEQSIEKIIVNKR